MSLRFLKSVETWSIYTSFKMLQDATPPAISLLPSDTKRRSPLTKTAHLLAVPFYFNITIKSTNTQIKIKMIVMLMFPLAFSMILPTLLLAPRIFPSCRSTCSSTSSNISICSSSSSPICIDSSLCRPILLPSRSSCSSWSRRTEV